MTLVQGHLDHQRQTCSSAVRSFNPQHWKIRGALVSHQTKWHWVQWNPKAAVHGQAQSKAGYEQRNQCQVCTLSTKVLSPWKLQSLNGCQLLCPGAHVKLCPWVGNQGCFVCVKLTSTLQARVLFLLIWFDTARFFYRCGFREPSFSEIRK